MSSGSKELGRHSFSLPVHLARMGSEKEATVADYMRIYMTDAPPSKVLDLAEAYLVGLRGFSVPLGHEPTQNSAEFHLRGGLLAALFVGHPTVKLTTEQRDAQTRLTISANREQLLNAIDAWASRELDAAAVS
jgi:hypothetical protein